MADDALTADRVIFFDSYCVLCNRFVSWAIAHDPERKFFFAALDSPLAQTLRADFPQANDVDSVLYWNGHEVFTKGIAVRKVIQDLSTWKIVKLGARLAPAFLLEAGYNLVAANRYKIFGKYEVCPPMPAEWRARFKN